MGSSVTNMPRAASMATRLCCTSASRHCFMVPRGFPVDKPRGSNPSSNGGRAPGNPQANFDSSGTHPLRVSRTVVEARPVGAGANATAEPIRVETMAIFIVLRYDWLTND